MGPVEHEIHGAGATGVTEKSRIADLPRAGFMDMFKEPQITSRAATKLCKDADEEASNTISSA
jgi:hypothetical protein